MTTSTFALKVLDKKVNKGEINMLRSIALIAVGTAIAALLVVLGAHTAHGQHIGDIYCSDGQYRAPEEYNAASGITAKGVVYWVSPTGEKGANRMVALKDAAKNVGWCGLDNKNTSVPGVQEVGADPASADPTTAHDVLGSAWCGKENTAALRKAHTSEKPYPAAMAIPDQDFQDGWYLPSMAELLMLAAQYRLVATALEAIAAKEPNAAEPMAQKIYYSSSIERQRKGAFYLSGSGYLAMDGDNYKNGTGVRAVRAF